MEDKIKNNIENSGQLEAIYQADKKSFKTAFFNVYPEIATYNNSGFWKVRLEYDGVKTSKVDIRKADILFLIIACVITGLLIKIPELFSINTNDFFFHEKNAGLIVLFGLSIYSFLCKGKLKTGDLIISISVFVFSAVYINLLPSIKGSNSINLAYIHLPLMLWCLYGLIYIDFDTRDKLKRIDFIKYNGDVAILVAIISIAGGILTGVTMGLFSAIDLRIEDFYMEYIVVWGVVSVAIVATFIIRFFPFVANKIAPIIANIFSPLVLLTLIVYLISIIITRKDPYGDREFLLVFNMMLLGVMGIIVFSVSEISLNTKNRFSEIVLFLLVLVSLIVNLIALSAIVYRLGEFGFTPNRTAVLGSNLLIFGNLILIMIDLYKVNFRNKNIKRVELTIAKYLPIYTLWTIFVVFALPFIFGFK